MLNERPTNYPDSAIKRNVELMSPEDIEKNYFDSMEKELKRRFNQECRKLPAEKRQLETVSDSNLPLVSREKIRRPREDHVLPGVQNLWLIVDFDDVISRTTTYNSDLRAYVCLVTGLDQKIYDAAYEQAKEAGAKGEKVFRFQKMIDKLSEMTGDNPGLAELKNGLPADLNPQNYIDRAVERALLALRSDENKYRYIKISILTYGDTDYQRMRIGQTDVDDIVDEIIYTEGLKSEAVKVLLEKDYISQGHRAPRIVTVDDSSNHVIDYRETLSDNDIHIDFQHPQAKRYNKDSKIAETVTDFESAKGKAASTIYDIATIAMQVSSGQTFDIRKSDEEGRTKAFQVLNDKTVYEKIRRSTYGDKHEMETNISYCQENNGKFYRESDYRPNYLDLTSPLSHRRTEIKQIDGKPIFSGPTHNLNLREFIEAAGD